MQAPITDINQLDMEATYTVADYLSWQFDELVQLIKGKVVRMSPAPRLTHAIISSKVERALYGKIPKGSACQVFHAPVDVYLGGDDREPSVVQPDIFIVCDSSKLQEQGCMGAPDWVCEILSPSSVKLDRLTKRALYEEAGVKEYTIVYPRECIIEVYRLQDNGFYGEPMLYTKKGDTWALKPLPTISLTYADVFGEEQ